MNARNELWPWVTGGIVILVLATIGISVVHNHNNVNLAKQEVTEMLGQDSARELVIRNPHDENGWLAVTFERQDGYKLTTRVCNVIEDELKKRERLGDGWTVRVKRGGVLCYESQGTRPSEYIDVEFLRPPPTPKPTPQP